MKRKTFLYNLSLGTIGTILFPSLSYTENNKSVKKSFHWLQVKHSGDDYHTVIKCDAIKKKLRIVHITDSHLTVLKNGVSEFPEFAERMNNAYKNPKHYLTGKKGNKLEFFDEILSEAKKRKADLILLTGDIVNNPSIYGINYLVKKLKDTGIDYLYIAGNHDWHFEGMKGSSDHLREKWIKKRLLPLYNGNNPLYYSKIINGINFVMIDDTTYQINKEQLDFFRAQTDKDYPIILSIHIPIYQPEDRIRESVYTIGDPRWGFDFDKNYEIERRERWSKEGNKKETLELIIEVLSCKKLLALFAGHEHSAMNKQISPSAYMYLTRASYSGAYRFIELTNNKI